jgi:hypothetical protein
MTRTISALPVYRTVLIVVRCYRDPGTCYISGVLSSSNPHVRSSLGSGTEITPVKDSHLRTESPRAVTRPVCGWRGYSVATVIISFCSQIRFKN